MKEDKVRKSILLGKMNSNTYNSVSTFRSVNRQQSEPSRVCFIFCLLITGLFSLATATPASAATYYLDAVNGNDSNPGTSELPWKTLAKAQSTLVSGDTVKMRNGNYGNFIENSKSHTDWITYEADTGHADVNFTPTASFPAIRLYNGDTPYDAYLTFRGINIVRSTFLREGAYLRGPNHVRFYDCNFIGSGYVPARAKDWANTAVFLRNVSDITLDGCKIYGTGPNFDSYIGYYTDGTEGGINGSEGGYGGGWVAGIVCDVGVSSLTINDCNIGGNDIALNLSGDDIVLSNSYIHNVTADFIGVGACNTDPNGDTRITITNNILYGGIEYWWGTDANNPNDFGFPGDPAYSAHTDGIQSSPTAPMNRATITNNIIYHNGGTGLYLKGPKDGVTQSVDWVIENNLIYDCIVSDHLRGFNANTGTVQIMNIDGLVFNNNTVIGTTEVYTEFSGGVDPNDKQPSTITSFSNNIINKVNFHSLQEPPLCDVVYANNNICNGDVYGMGDWALLGAATTVFNSYTGQSSPGFVPGPDVTSFKALFTNYNGNDFTLAVGSKAIDFGNPSYSPATDILGVSRVFPPDAGCYEYVSQSNNAPVLQAIGNKSVNENSSLSFSVSATDADGDTISYSASGTAIDAGAALSGQSFSWTPGYTQAGTYQVTFIASDGTDQDSETITITVSNTNRAPVLSSIGDKSVNENSSLSFSVSATDADGDTITYSATGLPTGATFSSQSFSWTPGYTQSGTYQVTFTASDGTDQDSETITITVNNTNRAPVLSSIGDKSVNENSTLSFSASATDADGDTITYSVQSLPSGAVFGSQTFTWTPGYTQAGTHQVTFIATAGGETDSETITITVNNVNRAPVLDSIGDKSVFTENSLTFTVSATDADSDTIIYSATNLPSGATFANQNFSWTPGSSQAGSYDVTFTASDSQTQDSEVITITVTTDTAAPTVSNLSPTADSIQASLNSLISLDVTDSGKGVNPSTVTIEVNSNLVYTGNTTNYNSSYGNCRRIGTSVAYKYIYQADERFDYGQTVTVTVNATDLAANPMDEYSYSFKTEMRSFGENKKVNSSSNSLNESSSATASDSNGDIWAVWHTGQTGSRDIYIGKHTADADSFGSSVQVTNDDADQTNPVIAIDSADKLYVAWQDSQNGEWDIYISTSTDGTNFSAATKITDPNSDQANPAIVIDSSNKAYIVWEDDQNSNSDIYIASSTNSFVSKTTSQITSNASSQTSPAIAVDSGNTVYVVWVDARGSTNDIYGADSTNGPWTNVAVVSNANNQSSPAIATESAGSILHFLWVDNTSGNNDIYYASSNGLPGSSLSGSSLIDDTSGAIQSAPVITVTGSTGNDLKVFACWKDERNVSSGNGDTDIYFVEVNSDSGTNVLVGDDSTNSAQSYPAMGIDGYGYPYLAWTDGRNTSTDIYYAGSTFVESTTLESEDVAASLGATVGTELANINSTTDVSVIIPAGAGSHDATITISRVKNLQKVSLDNISAPYEFGPSGIEFDQPVTIIIPYDISIVGNSPSAYWYNPLTNVLSQQGITNVETIEISSTLHALRFKTTHFTQFLVGGSIAAAAAGGGGGGGGCSMSPNGQGSIVEFLLPYIGLAVVMTILKLRNRQKKNVHNITGSG